MKPIKLAICEDVKEVREGFRYLLELDPEIRISGVFPDAESLISALKMRDAKPEIILMDIVLPGMSGIEATGLIKSDFPEIDVLILTIFEEEKKILDAIERGAAGYILKNTKPADLVTLIKELKAGGSPVSPHVARTLFSELRRERNRQSADDFKLTAREREIVEAIVEGLTYREIADRYHIAGSTVKTHILNIYRKLEVNSRVQFMKKVMNSDLF